MGIEYGYSNANPTRYGSRDRRHEGNTMLRTSLRYLCAVVAAAVLATACSRFDQSADPWGEVALVGDVELVPLIVSSDIAIGGSSRFLFSLLDGDSTTIASPDLAVRVEFFDLGASPDEPVSSQEADFVWSIPGVRGMYTATPDFRSAGRWGVKVTADVGDGETSVHVRFDVAPEPQSAQIGTPAPRSVTKTVADTGGDLSTITTDADPDPDLYEVSIADAIDAGEPFIVTFGSPKFCQSGVCGPVLDNLRAVKVDEPDFRFLHVELFTDLSAPRPTPVASIDEWGMRTEPWTFVIAADGTIADKFEGPVGRDEIRSAIAAVK